MGLPRDTSRSGAIMGLKEGEVMETVKGVAKQSESLGVSASVSVFGLKGWCVLV